MKNQKYISKRQKDLEATEKAYRAKKDGCFHDIDHWCQNCLNFGREVDLTSERLGRGHIITNVDPYPDNLNGSNSTRINI